MAAPNHMAKEFCPDGTIVPVVPVYHEKNWMVFGVFIVSFRIFGLASLVAVSLSISGAAHANLFKDLKKALGDVEKQLAPQGGGNGNSASSGGSTQSSGGASSPVAASQPDDFGDSESSIRFICEPVPTSSIYKKLSQPDFKTVESDFGMPKDQLDIAFKKSKPVSHPYLISFDIYKTGFATDEVEELFDNFLRRPNATDLAVMVATANTNSFDAKKKVRAADAKFAYGLVHHFFPDAGGKQAVGERLIKEAAKSNQFAARYVEGLRWYKGYGRDVNLKNAVSWMRPGYEEAQQMPGDLAHIIEDTFMRLVVEPGYENRDMYIGLIAEAEKNRAALEQQMKANSGNSAITQALRPQVMELMRMRGELLIDLATLGKIGSEVEKYKADYNMLASQSDPSVATVNELIVKTAAFDDFMSRKQESFGALDAVGKERLQGIYQRTEAYVLKARTIGATFAFSLAMGGSFGDLLDEESIMLFKEVAQSRPIACELRRSILAYAKRTNAKLESKPVPFSENVLPKRSGKKKKR